MTKEELARKKGIKLPKEKQSPSDSLVTTKNNIDKKVEDKVTPKKAERAKNPKTSELNRATTSKSSSRTNKTALEKPSSVAADVPDQSMAKPVETTETPIVKRGPGKPRKRKDGDKKISFWLDEDLLHGLYDNLSYGESAGEAINVAIREYQQNHGLYKA